MVGLQGTVAGLVEDPGKGPANHVFVLDHQDDPGLIEGYQGLGQKRHSGWVGIGAASSFMPGRYPRGGRAKLG